MARPTRNLDLDSIQAQIAELEKLKAEAEKQRKEDVSALIEMAAKIGLDLPDDLLIGALVNAREKHAAGSKEAAALMEKGATFLGKRRRKGRSGASDKPASQGEGAAINVPANAAAPTESKPASVPAFAETEGGILGSP